MSIETMKEFFSIRCLRRAFMEVMEMIGEEAGEATKKEEDKRLLNVLMDEIV